MVEAEVTAEYTTEIHDGIWCVVVETCESEKIILVLSDSHRRFIRSLHLAIAKEPVRPHTNYLRPLLARYTSGVPP